MGRCNPKTNTCTRTPWWREAMGINWYGQGGGVQEPFLLIAYNHNLSNKFVDLYFNRGIYSNGGAISTSNIVLAFTAGGATNLAIASVKKPDHHVSASASALAGGESVIRVFLTVTGTTDGTEFYSLSTTGIKDVNGNSISQGTGNIYLTINLQNLWDAEVQSAVTVTGAGISSLVDLIGNLNVDQSVDADRPRYWLDHIAQFDRANDEFLLGANNSVYEKQQADDFAIYLRDLHTNQLGEVNQGFIIAYYGGTVNGGWIVSAFHTTGTLRFLHGDQDGPPPNNNIAQLIFEDQFGDFILQNEGGVLKIYDENNNLVGTQGSTVISSIPYTSEILHIGRREAQTVNYLNGDFKKIGTKMNGSLSSDTRKRLFKNGKIQFVNTEKTLTKYMFPMLNASTNSSAKDTMQCFLGDVVLRDGVYHMFYTGNAGPTDGDIDKIFKATKTDDGSNDPFVKVLDAGLPKIILGPSGVPGYDENQIFCRTVFYDESAGHWKMYFTASDESNNPNYTTGLATAADGENFTKVGQVYSAGVGFDTINFAVVKVAVGDYRAVASVRPFGVLSAYSFKYLTSADGETWVEDSDITSLFTFKSIIYVTAIRYINNEFVILTNANNRDGAPSNTDDMFIWKTTDFAIITFAGKLMGKHEPSERSVWAAGIVTKANTTEIFYNYFKNQNKVSGNGGEGYISVRRAIIDSAIIQQCGVVEQYPSWVKKYWPLNRESCIDNLFYEYIDQQTTTFAGVKQWSIDGLNFFDFLGTGFSFPAIDLSGYTDNISLKMRVEIIITGTINLFSIGTDIVVQLVNGNLRVALNNATKDYITNADIAKPTGITDVGNHVYVGFIFSGGILKLCVGNTVDIASTKTVDGAMTDILNGGANVLICNGSTIEAGRVVLMSGQTDQQWIDTDL